MAVIGIYGIYKMRGKKKKHRESAVVTNWNEEVWTQREGDPEEG